MLRHISGMLITDDPWDLIVYADGVSPEDTLSKNDKRKFWAIYWSFHQFGQEALGTEEPWFTLAIVRLTELSKLDGGLPHLFGALLDTYMFNPEGVNCSSSGVALAMASGVVILRSTSVIFIGDGPAKYLCDIQVSASRLFRPRGCFGRAAVSASRLFQPRGCFGLAVVSAQGVMASNTDAV